jgi:hypothetical protein
MPNVMDGKKEILANEQAFEKAGFRSEQVGKSTVYERKLSKEILEATRALITGGNGNGHVNGNGNINPNGASPKTVDLDKEKTVP